MLNENQIYQKFKTYLLEHNWNILGGEPPGGTDNDVPVIELKDPDNTRGGSTGSKKIDLICFKEEHFLLLELKKIFAESDITKLNDICGSEIWRKEFLHALREKHRLPPNLQEENYTDNDELLIKALSFNDTGKKGPEDFITFLVSNNNIQTHFGANITENIRNLF